MNYPGQYKKIIKIICQDPSFRIFAEEIYLKCQNDIKSFEALKALLERMIIRGWLKKECIQEPNRDPRFNFAWNRGNEGVEYIYSLTPTGEKKFRKEIEVAEEREAEATYKVVYNISSGDVYEADTKKKIRKINRGSPMYVALGLVFKNRSYEVKVEDILKLHRKSHKDADIFTVDKAFRNFKTPFFKQIISFISADDKKPEFFSIVGDSIKIPPFLKIEK